MDPPREKDKKLEALRGLAILLVVAAHADVWPPGQSPGFFSGFKYIFSFIRMPLFACISGYVYALRPLAPGAGWKFLGGKVRRLLLPMVCVGAFSSFFKLSPPYVEIPQNIWQIGRLLISPVHQFWFLQTLFLIFAVIVVLESLKWLDRVSFWLAAAGLMILAAFVAQSGIFKSINPPISPRPMIFLLPYFLFGLGVCRFEFLRKNRWITMTALALAAAGLALQIGILAGRLKIPDQRDTPFYLCSSSAYMFLLLKARWKVKGLSILGNFSYSIFLFHFYVILVMKAILAASPLILPSVARYAIVFLSAIGLSILAQLLLKRLPLTRRLFLGLR
jgi:peptidoglycan/LPS O-acetylase OafA/YrhL